MNKTGRCVDVCSLDTRAAVTKEFAGDTLPRLGAHAFTEQRQRTMDDPVLHELVETLKIWKVSDMVPP